MRSTFPFDQIDPFPLEVRKVQPPFVAKPKVKKKSVERLTWVLSGQDVLSDLTEAPKQTRKAYDRAVLREQEAHEEQMKAAAKLLDKRKAMKQLMADNLKRVQDEVEVAKIYAEAAAIDKMPLNRAVMHVRNRMREITSNLGLGAPYSGGPVAIPMPDWPGGEQNQNAPLRLENAAFSKFIAIDVAKQPDRNVSVVVTMGGGGGGAAVASTLGAAGAAAMAGRRNM